MNVEVRLRIVLDVEDKISEVLRYEKLRDSND